LITDQNGATTIADRKLWQQKLFMFHLIMPAIFNYFNTDETIFKETVCRWSNIRYGENPHQKDSSLVILTMFNKLHGKELSYNNLLDVDAAVI
jgi:phosphoribosylaminoimidazolecarboxamide formyltransferase/IMP cyclohydrolase